MEFELSPEQQAIRSTAREFARKELMPHASVWEEEGHFPREAYQKASEVGFTGMLCPEEYSGSGSTRLEVAIVMEELAQGCIAVPSYLGVHLMVQSLIHRFGDESQRQQWLPNLASARQLGAFALTEPEAGSDAASIQTTATRDGDSYILAGSKIFISAGGEAELYTVITRTDRSRGSEGMTAFVVEKGTPGFKFGRKDRKMGLNAGPTSELIFEDCRVPAGNRLADEGQGFKIAMSSLDGGRVNVGALSVGGAQAALDAAVEYAKGRRQFGKPIAAFQGLQFMMADMAAEIEASRLLVYQAAHKMDIGQPVTFYAAIAKRFATDTFMKVATDAVQIFGGYGYMREYPVESLMRAAKLMQIVEGTNQIQRLVIARRLLDI